MSSNRFGLFERVTIMASLAFLGSFAGVAQAAVLPGWMADTANGTIAFPSPITAGSHSADSTGSALGSATFTLNSGSFNNWLMADGGTYESVPSGNPLDMEYGKSRNVDLSVIAADTLRVQEAAGFIATGPASGEGDDRVTESQFLRITAQSDVTVLITSVSASQSGFADPGSGSRTVISSEGGFYENGVPLSPTAAGTYNLVTGNFYDFFSLITFDVHENAAGFDGARFGIGYESTFDIQVIIDCNNNGTPDDQDIAGGLSQDCNANAIPDECDIASGTSLDGNGDGVPDECPAGATGACCSRDCDPSGTIDCCEISPGACSTLGGDYQGDGTTCAANPCPSGACCFFGGPGAGSFCGEYSADLCSQFGGHYRGDGTTCADANSNGAADECEVGACCTGTTSADRACTLTSSADCATLGGAYLGDQTPCEQTTLIPIHDGPPAEWSHRIVTTSNCPDPSSRGTSGECAGGPYMIDPWATAQDGSSNCEDFGAPSSCVIPAGFFGTNSDAFSGQVCFAGQPIGPVTLPGFSGSLDFGDADTLVQRSADPFAECDLPGGGPSSVNIMVVRLNLTSSAPITVTYGGGPTESWNVRVEVLSAIDPPQPAGSLLTAIKTGSNGGTFDSTLAVCPRFVFTQVGSPSNVRTLDYCTTCSAAGIVMTADDVGWIHTQGNNIDLDNPVCTEFHAGLAESRPDYVFDCNGNTVRDSCDVPTGDVNGDTYVNLYDLYVIVDCFRGPCGVEGLPCDDPPFDNPCCHLADFNSDADIDLQDLAVFQSSFTN